MSWCQIGVGSSATTVLTIQFNTLRRRQMTVMASRNTGQSSVCLTVCSDWQQKHQRSALLSLCEEKPLWPVVSPHKRTVKRKTFYLMTSWWIKWYDGKCIILRNMHIASQPLNKQWSIEVGMSSSRRFLCYPWVHYLRTITRRVKNCETATCYLPPAGCGRWAHKVTKGLPENFAGETDEVLVRFKPTLACPLGGSVDGAD